MCVCVKVWHLQRMLLNRVDATTNEQFLDVVLKSSEYMDIYVCVYMCVYISYI